MSIIRDGLQSADLDAPVTSPTLSLDFANSQSLDPRITFTRGSIGTRVNRNGLIETVAANQPRFDFDPISGECKGLLIEESRQNLLTYSEDFSNAVWTKLGSSVSTNVSVTTAPDNSNTSDKLIEDTTNGEHRFLSSSISWVGNIRYTFSLFVKPAERTRFDFLFGTAGNWSGGRGVSFDLISGTILSTDGATGNIIKLPNGWYKCSITALSVASPTASQVVLRMINTGTNASYQGDGTSGIYVWGAQLETGAFPTSYIPTSGSTVTRSADILDILGSNFTNFFGNTSPNELSVFYSGNSPYTYNYSTATNTYSPFYWTLTNNDNTERIDFRYAGLPQVIPILNGASSVGGVFPNASQINDIKSVALIDSKSFAIILNNGNPDYQFTKSTRLPRMPFGFTRLRIGSSATGGLPLNGTMRKLAIYPKRLSFSQATYLTQ